MGGRTSQGQNVSLFTTSSDWTGWTAGYASTSTASTSTSYDSDGVTVNGLGNNPGNSGSTLGAGASSTGGSIQITNTGTLGYTELAYSPGEAYNQAFMSAIDPGSIAAYSAAAGFGDGTLVAYSGTLQMNYTMPSVSGGSYLQFGVFFNDSPDGYYHPELSTNVVNDGTIDGMTTYTAFIPYTLSAGNFNNLNLGIFVNSDQTLTAPVYFDSLQTYSPAVFNAVNANWVTNGSGAWESATNWNPSAPGVVGSTATFDSDGGTITTNPTVTLSSQVTVDSINFNTAAISYTIVNGGGGSITLDTNTGNQVNVFAGNHSINVPVIMQGSTTFSISTGSTLSLASVSGGGFGVITVTGGGTLIENQIASTSVSLDIIGATLTTLSATTSPQELYYFNIYNSGVLNLNGTLIVDGINFDAGATINLGSAGQLLTPGGTFNFNGTIAGSGAIGIGGAPNNTSASMATFNGTNSNYSGPVSVTNGSTLIIAADANLGNGSATDTITLDNATRKPPRRLPELMALIAGAGGGTFNSSGFNVSLGSIAGAGTLSVVGGGVVTVLPQSVGGGLRKLTLGGLNISSGEVSLGTAVSHADKTVLATGGLVLSGTSDAWTSTLDLGGNDLIVQGGSLSTVTNQVRQGFAGGSWQGSGGIVSAAASVNSTHLTALGVIQNSTTGTSSGSPLYATFDGVASSNLDILVKYTYFGDANLDGKVDGSDYSRIDASTVAEKTAGAISGWFNGDFNYDGVVNGSDYTLIDNAFNRQGAILSTLVAGPLATNTAQIATGSAVPEPVCGSAILLAWGLLGRRRRSCKT